MAQTIYIIRELNVPEGVGGLTDQGTVWIAVDEWDAHAEPRKATKISRPIPIPIADQIAEGLHAAFEQLGYAVRAEISADD